MKNKKHTWKTSEEKLIVEVYNRERKRGDGYVWEELAKQFGVSVKAVTEHRVYMIGSGRLERRRTVRVLKRQQWTQEEKDMLLAYRAEHGRGYRKIFAEDTGRSPHSISYMMRRLTREVPA